MSIDVPSRLSIVSSSGVKQGSYLGLTLEKIFWSELRTWPGNFSTQREVGIPVSTMSTIVQAATTTYASRIKTGNTPLIIPSPALVARNRSLVTGTPLVPPPALQSRPFRSNSRLNGDDDDDDDDEEFLEVESEEGKKDKEEDELEESGGFVLGPPPDTLIQRRNAVATKHVYRWNPKVLY